MVCSLSFWCQKALNDISTRHAVGLYRIRGHAGVRGNKIAELARDGSVQRLVGTEPFLEKGGGVSRQNIRRKMKCWVEKQHLVLWRGPCSRSQLKCDGTRAETRFSFSVETDESI